jgi:hypothetical protein
MKMRKLAVMAVGFVATLSMIGVVCAEEFRSPVLFKSDVDFDTGAKMKIAGTTVTATASQLNSLTGSGTMTPNNVTMTGVMTTTPIANVAATNGQTLTMSGFINLITSTGKPNVNTNAVTLAAPSAAGQWALLYNQKTSTNLLSIASSGTFHGPAVELSAGEGVLLFAPSATNWAGIGQ